MSAFQAVAPGTPEFHKNELLSSYLLPIRQFSVEFHRVLKVPNSSNIFLKEECLVIFTQNLT